MITTQEAVEIIESINVITYKNKIKLLKIIAENEQYRKNPLSKMQGCKKWVKQNDINEQLVKLKSEIEEFDRENNFEKKILEWWDIGQVWLTGIIILKIKYGVDIDKLVDIGQRKNSNRGYDI